VTRRRTVCAAESVIVEDVGGNIDKLKAVRDLGVGIAIDDFRSAQHVTATSS